MALLFMDGAEHYASADLSEKYAFNAAATVVATRARTGASSISGGSLGVAVNASGATAIVGFGVFATALGSQWCTIGSGGFGASAYYHVTVKLESDGSITARNGGATGTILGQTAAGVCRIGVWHYLELKVVLHDTTGTVTVKVNGLSVLALTNQDTVGTPATATWTTVEWTLGGGAGFLDDIYVCDGSGAQNNDVLGECRVVTLLPVTDAVAPGSQADFTPSTGTDHGAMVNDAAPNDDTDYVASSTVTNVDSWHYPALGYTGTIKGVQLSLSAKKTDAGARAISGVTRVGGSGPFVHPTDHYLGTSYVYWLSLWEVNPGDSAAWEVADVDGAEFGVRVMV